MVRIHSLLSFVFSCSSAVEKSVARFWQQLICKHKYEDSEHGWSSHCRKCDAEVSNIPAP
jgi:hypothetical protein